MIKAIVIDDECNARTALKKLVEKYCDSVSIIAEASSVTAGVELIKNLNPDLVFLDVEMPEHNGFSLFEKIAPITFEVIFTTAYDQYALKAIKYSALDYLLKPINIVDLQTAIAKVTSVKKLALNQNRFEVLVGNVNNNMHQLNKIAIPSIDSYVMVKITDILYCEADGNYAYIYLLNQEKILVSKTLKWIEELLPESTFFRIHKSYIINLNLMKKYLKTEDQVLMENEILLAVSDRQRKELIGKIVSK